jgi:ribosomal protein S18 acetylase RimI-like enzyme
MGESAGSGFAAYEPRPAHERSEPCSATIREPLPAELTACAAMVVSRAGGDPDVQRDRLVADLADDNRQLLVAVVGREVVGFGKVMHFVAPAGSPQEIAPDGYYLVGLYVAPGWRRRGIGELLTTARMAWVARRADTVWYFANGGNGATLDLHRRHGFVEVSRRFVFPGVTFADDNGILLRASLT